jgi:RimJ/RimL family protein N-acetyltransferase
MNEIMNDPLGIAVDPAPRPRPERRIISGRSVTLEPLTGQHAAVLWAAARDTPTSWTWLPVGPFVEFNAFAGYVRFMAVSQSEIVWAVRPHDQSGQPGPAAGWLALLDIRPNDAAIELGNIWFPPGLARSRAASEAMFLLLNEAFTLGYRRISWKCNLLNLASMRAAERLGFTQEGVLRAHMVVRGHRRDTAYYSMLDDEWPTRYLAISAWLHDANFNRMGRAIRSLQRMSGTDGVGAYT